MKIKINETVLFHSKNVNDFKLMVASNFHYNKYFKLDIFNDLKETIINEQPDYLVIPGNLVASSTTSYYNLYHFLDSCSELTKVIITLGASDLKNKEQKIMLNSAFFNSLEDIKNLKLFRENNHESFQNDGVTFYGYSPEVNWYTPKKTHPRMFEFELMSYLIESSADKNLYNILLTPDVRNIFQQKDEFQKYILNDIDLVVGTTREIIPKEKSSDLVETSLIVNKGINSVNPFQKPEVDIVKIKKLHK